MTSFSSFNPGDLVIFEHGCLLRDQDGRGFTRVEWESGRLPVGLVLMCSRKLPWAYGSDLADGAVLVLVGGRYGWTFSDNVVRALP